MLSRSIHRALLASPIQRLPLLRLMSTHVPFTLEPPAHVVDDLPRAAKVIARAFDTLPFAQYIGVSTQDGIMTQEQFYEYYVKRVKQLCDMGAVLLQSNEYAGVALWLPPNYHKEPPKTEGLSGELMEVVRLFEYAEKKYGYDQIPHWHLQYLARDPERPHDASTRGAVSNVVKPVLKHAKEVDHMPAVLESAGGNATKVYTHLGFELLEELEIAKTGIFVDYMVFNK